MSGWGQVISIEAQERIFYALAGNIAINNCFNARAIHAAVADKVGTMRIPTPDYLKPASFGSLELRARAGTEFIGQPIDYSDTKATTINTVTIDSFNLARIDVIKMDVEGMELEAIEGGKASIERFHPIMLVEAVKTDAAKLRATLEQFGYRVFPTGLNLLAIHETDKSLTHVNVT
jgi:FkbM family methyltransferase